MVRYGQIKFGFRQCKALCQATCPRHSVSKCRKNSRATLFSLSGSMLAWVSADLPYPSLSIPIPHSNIYQQPYITTTFENIRPVKTYPFPHPLWFYLGQPAIILKDACFHLLKPRNLQAVKWARRPLFCIRNLYIYNYIYILYKRMLFTIKIRFAQSEWHNT
jgi:hypothetical protein